MNRLVELPPEQQTPEQKKVFEQLVAGRGRILGPYKIWIHSPTVASGMEHIGTYLNKKGSLSEREVEIGILVIAQHWDADYVRQAHIKMGRQVGLTQEIIDAVLAGRDPKLSDPHERAVHRFAAALVADGLHARTDGLSQLLEQTGKGLRSRRRRLVGTLADQRREIRCGDPVLERGQRLVRSVARGELRAKPRFERVASGGVGLGRNARGRPACPDLVDPRPLRFDFVATDEQCRVAFDQVEQQPLIGDATAIFAEGIGKAKVERHLA